LSDLVDEGTVGQLGLDGPETAGEIDAILGALVAVCLEAGRVGGLTKQPSPAWIGRFGPAGSCAAIDHVTNA
jgi:hypothetical protein